MRRTLVARLAAITVLFGLAGGCASNAAPASDSPTTDSPARSAQVSTALPTRASTDVSTTGAPGGTAVTAQPTAPSAPPTQPAAPVTTEPEIEIPAGVLVAVPTQNREDPAKNQFQVQLHNGTRDRYDVDALRFEWAGFSTATDRSAIVVGGLVIDFPVPLPPATCAGDGTIATMPDVAAATVVLTLIDGTDVVVPVVDKWHVTRRLYLEDCERQLIESLVTIDWVDLHETEFDGRPVTEGSLRLTRQAGIGTYVIASISNTVPYEFQAVDTAVGQPVVTLADGEPTAEVPIRFLESRCDPHALAEVKQPTKFVSQVVFPDGTVHPYIVYPERSYWNVMRHTADAACVALGEVEFVGE